MNIKNLLKIFILGSIVYSSSACSIRVSQGSPQQTPSIMQQPERARSKSPSPLDGQFSSYVKEAREKFYQEQFTALDDDARKMRLSKDRLPGGYWKLNALYSALGEPEGDEEADESMWQMQLALLHKWVAQQPQSLTAKVGLGQALINYAWKARGNGYANTVTDDGWKLFKSRLAEAEQVLDAARALPGQCPHWYVSMLQIGQSTGWEVERFDQVFAEAVKLEPTYYYYYRVRATYLLPRWHGETGDWEKFAKDSAQRIGGDDGDIIFLLMYTHMMTMHDLTFMNDHHAEWPQLLAGFRALEKHFGASPQRLNEACLMASSVGDQKVAAELFQKIGSQYDATVWRSKKNFEMFRGWALNSASRIKG